MAEKLQMTSSLGRSRHRMQSYVELLPKDLRLDATICLTELCDEAERDIERAYWDGFKQHSLQSRLPRSPQETGNG
jgi:hypothetical protein